MIQHGLALEPIKNRYAYTTGGDRDLSHLELIDRGGFGEVHKVFEPL